MSKDKRPSEPRQSSEEPPSPELGRAAASPREISARREELLAFRGELFVGPLPHPDLLAGYEDACPGAAERILVMAEKQGDHRRKLEEKIVDGRIIALKRGQVLAFTLALFVSGIGGYLLAQGQSLTGFGSLLLGLTSLISSTIIHIRREKKSDRQLPREESSLLSDRANSSADSDS